jgi:hypothetical protein
MRVVHVDLERGRHRVAQLGRRAAAGDDVADERHRDLAVGSHLYGVERGLRILVDRHAQLVAGADVIGVGDGRLSARGAGQQGDGEGGRQHGAAEPGKTQSSSVLCHESAPQF